VSIAEPTTAQELADHVKQKVKECADAYHEHMDKDWRKFCEERGVDPDSIPAPQVDVTVGRVTFGPIRVPYIQGEDYAWRGADVTAELDCNVECACGVWMRFNGFDGAMAKCPSCGKTYRLRYSVEVKE